MINRGTKKLRKQLLEAQRLIKNTTGIEEKVALANYIGNLYRAILCMGYDVTFNKKKCFGNRRNYNKFIKRLDIYSDKMFGNFILKKDFHSSYFGEVIPEVEDEMRKIGCMSFKTDDSSFSCSDFIDVFYQFMASLSLGEMFDKFYDSQQIHSSIVGSDANNLGFTLFNPINGCTDLIVKDLKPDLNSMNTLAHEFGHAYDLDKFHGDVKTYNKYFYVSFFGEVISRLFERLLFRFLLKNGIKTEAVKDKIIDFECLNFDFLMDAYILSLLDSDFLQSDQFIDCDSSVMFNMVKSHFYEDADVIGYIERMDGIDLAEVFNYAYGDIISLFLCEDVEKNGLSSNLIDYFFQKRCNLFDEEFLRECGFGPENYAKLYKKEVQYIKK